MSKANDAPIIVIKKVVGGHGHHGGSWKVAYADFVTAMMALFIVLWVLAQNDKAKNAVALYFTEPQLTPKEIKIRLEHPALASSKIKMVEPKDKKIIYRSYLQEMAALAKLAEKIKNRLEHMAWYKSMRGQLLIELTDEGLRIEFLDQAKSPFFEIGSAVPCGYTREALTAISRELHGVPNPVCIEGHTDARPFRNAAYYSNWELSADRANAARRILEQGGLKRSQIEEIRGLADTRLRIPSDPCADSNRRISLVVRYLSKKPPMGLEEGLKLANDKSVGAKGAEGTTATGGHGAEGAATPAAEGHGAEGAATPAAEGHGAEGAATPAAEGHGAEGAATPAAGGAPAHH